MWYNSTDISRLSPLWKDFIQIIQDINKWDKKEDEKNEKLSKLRLCQ